MPNNNYALSAYDYHLPRELIAQKPTPQRDQSRLLVLNLVGQQREHRLFCDLCSYFRPGDLLVLNESRVFPARLLGRKESGGVIELLLLEFPQPSQDPIPALGWMTARAKALLKSSKRARPGALLLFGAGLQARLRREIGQGQVEVILEYAPDKDGSLEAMLDTYGQAPLPPYIERRGGQSPEDKERYQTCYARELGSVAAPTAGLHCSPEFLERLHTLGVRTSRLALHVGYGTFAPVRAVDIRQHQIHAEELRLSEECATVVNQVKQQGGRIWALGTTTLRGLEAAADASGLIHAYSGPCTLYIYPGHHFRVVDNLITNFHLPQSSLLFLVAALAGKEQIFAAYQEALSMRYRFFSYGDAMAIIRR